MSFFRFYTRHSCRGILLDFTYVGDGGWPGFMPCNHDVWFNVVNKSDGSDLLCENP